MSIIIFTKLIKPMENKIKHLEFIQWIIQRMAHNSFIIKWWVILVFVWITSFSLKEEASIYLIIVAIIIFIFWFLDSYYLTAERKFRKLYNDVRIKDESNIDFDMDIWQIYFKEILNTFSSITNVLFYLVLLFIVTIFYFLIK